MVSIKILLGSVLLISSTLNSIAQNKIEVDVCIYGGTSAGVMAAYTAKKLGKKVILIEPGNSLGGLSSGGLGFTDIGNKYAISGLALDFYRRIGAHYGKFEQWIFEPHVAEDLFRQYISRAGADVLYGQRLLSVQKQGKRLKQIILENASAPDANTGQKINVRKLQSMLHSNPLADGSRADIFVDNEQSADIKLMGGWELNRDPKNNYAASSFRINGSEGGNASVKFTPTIPVSGRYKVYSYTPKLIKPSTSLSANVYDGRKLSSVAIDMRSFKVEGQTSGEWVELGEYIFEKGRTGFIEITNKTANGTVVADAVLLVPSK